MPVLKPRNRLVYFRVSEDEFQQFSRVCTSEGARSLSELARSAMHRAINESNSSPEDAVVVRLKRLDDLIVELESRTRELGALIQEQLNGNQKEQASATSV